MTHYACLEITLFSLCITLKNGMCANQLAGLNDDTANIFKLYTPIHHYQSMFENSSDVLIPLDSLEFPQAYIDRRDTHA